MNKVKEYLAYIKGLLQAAATGDNDTFEHYKKNWKGQEYGY